MNRIVFTFAALAFAASAVAQQPKPGVTDEKALTQIEDEMVAAIVKSDVATVERHLAPGFVFVGPDGVMQDRAQFIADIKGGSIKLESSKNDEMKVRTFGNSAVVIYRSTDKGTFKGQDISGQYRWTDVFVKKDGKWQIVSTQGTAIPPPKPATPAAPAPAKPAPAPQPPKK